jgi:hypothetical protein
LAQRPGEKTRCTRRATLQPAVDAFEQVLHRGWLGMVYDHCWIARAMTAARWSKPGRTVDGAVIGSTKAHEPVLVPAAGLQAVKVSRPNCPQTA